MSDQELVDLFHNNNNNYISYLPNDFQYNWKKRLSIYNTKSNSVTSHEYRWLVEALRCHSQNEFFLLRQEIERLLPKEGGLEDKNKSQKENSGIKKIQSCPVFHTTTKDVIDVIEKTVNSC
jgi:uncharacterized protein YbaR (Trm112 family)